MTYNKEVPFSGVVLKTAIYAGSFDMLTAGHVFVINEALAIFGKLYIAIGTNPGKKTAYSLEDRIQMIKNAFPNEPKIEVVSFENQFLVNFCRNNNIDVMVRGIRNVADLEYETQILYINEKINKNIKSVYFIPPTELAGVSSSMVKGLIGFPEWQFAVEGLVPKANMPMINEVFYGEKLLKSVINPGLYPGVDFAPVVTKIYSANGRYYHTLQHLTEMLIHIHENSGLAMFDWRKPAMFKAAVYHDIVYDPLGKDNEEKSVEKFLEMAKGEDRSAEETDLIRALILATKNHESDDDLHNTFIDADLSILGSVPDRFNEYERQIRAEYSMAPDNLYNRGRAEFIEEMLARPKIFLTKGSAKFEVAARSNLKSLLARLRA